MIARNTAFTYKGKPFDIKTIGRELSVRYVLEGSIQRGGNRLRTNVQLIDTETGNHLWAERFDKPLADLFDMQDEIVARLAGAMNAQLVAAEARRAERTPNPNSISPQSSRSDDRDFATVTGASRPPCGRSTNLSPGLGVSSGR